MPDASSWTDRFATALYAWRRWALAVVALLTIGAVVPALQVGVDTAVQHWFTEGDPVLADYREFQATYGNDEIVFIGLRRPDGMLTPTGMSILRTATKRVRSVDGVASVTSLTTQRRTQTTLAGPQLVPLVPPGSLSAEQARALRTHVLQDSTYARLVGPDGTMAAVIARMQRNARIDGRRGAILDSIRQKLAPLDASVHLAGTGVILNALNEAATLDTFLLVLASSALIFLLLWGYFRRVAPVFLTMGVVGAATVWLMGAYGLAGRDINMLTLVMPTLVLVVCTADCVHLLTYAADLPDALSPRARTVQTLSALATPCLVTTLTTAAGFASLTTSSMSIVRGLGLFSAVGVLFGLFVAFVGCAAALPHDAVLPDRSAGSGLQRIVDGTVGLGLRRWRPVLVGTALVVLVAGAGLRLITVDTNPIGYFFADHPVRQDSRLIEQKIGPYAPLEFVVEADSSMLKPTLLRAVGRWQERATETGAVQWHRSPVDALRRLHAALPNGAPTVPSSPTRLRGLVQLGQDQFPYLKDLRAHPNQLRVTFGMPIRSANGIQRTIDSVRAAAAFPHDVRVRPAGYLPLYVHMMTLLSNSLVRSFGLALLVVLGVIGVLFRSVRAVALSLLTNGLPVLLALGLIGWMGIPLDVATMTIAAIVLGLVVDDTVHLLHRYATARGASSPVAALRTSAQQAGPRMAITTSVLAGGVLVLCLAQITSIVWFGLLSSVAIAAALAADLLTLPAVVVGLYGPDDE
ncbi:MAG: RND family transporter [Salinibacter sp.]|uniref:RND family transporter n=1 Tax=Salinibacter sp. TaxID=2065818 RepID=UPI0035D42FCF